MKKCEHGNNPQDCKRYTCSPLLKTKIKEWENRNKKIIQKVDKKAEDLGLYHIKDGVLIDGPRK